MYFNRLDLFTIIGSFIFFSFVFELVRKRKIKEEYSVLWLFFSITFICLALFRQSLDFLSHLLGIAYPPAALFLFLIVGLLSILIHFSIVISGLSEKVKVLVQEIGMLKMQIKPMSLEEVQEGKVTTRSLKGESA